MTPDPQLLNKADALRGLIETAARLADDPAPVETLTKMLFAIEARLAGLELPAEHVGYLYETGAFIISEDHNPSPLRGRIKVQLVITEGDHLHLLCTRSLMDTAGYLGWEEEDVLTAADEGRLYAIEELGLTRFPSWQFDNEVPGKILPGLSKIIELIDPNWPSLIIQGYLKAPQKGLIPEGYKAPIEWLRDGGDVETVIEHLKTRSGGW